jgi:CDP-glycerol glycerophosphotransferase (TagB/SpsB family)
LSGKVVLYAPTWAGFSTDTNYCSLPVARRLIDRVLELGATVIFRPHPYTEKDARSAAITNELDQLLRSDKQATGRNHLWGKASREDVSIIECFNRSDAMIADVSSTVTDFLFSEKPFAVVDMLGEGDGFVQNFPLADGAYILRNDLSNLEQAITDLLVSDPKGHIRRSLKGHYLGNFPAETYADGFVDAARRVVLGKD